MTRTALLLIPLLIAAVASPVGAEVALVPAGAVWTYLDVGAVPDTLWTTLAYADTGWSVGTAQFGYGDGDEATLVDYGPDPEAKYATTYFRHVFAYADTAAWLALELKLLRDDGAVVHLNGDEIHRSNLPAGPIGYDTWASTPAGTGDENVFHVVLLDPALLVEGDNVLAVEVHQFNGTSSDLSFDLELNGLDALPAPFAKGPRLIYKGVDTEMHLVWQLETTLPARVEWGDDPTCSQGGVQTAEYGTRHQHAYTFTGLDHAATTYYRVIAQTDTLRGSFVSAPPDTADALKFLVYGDTRTYPANHDAVAAAMLATAAQDPAYRSFALVAGDLVEYGDQETSWRTEFFDTTYMHIQELLATIPYQACMGNHEQSGVLFTEYFPYPFVERRYWSFDYGPAHFVVFDQYTTYSPGSAQLAWLENDLAATDKPWKFILLHEPGWSAGPHPDLAEVQQRIQPLCEQHDVAVVFAGHNHIYARAEVGPVTHVTSGGGGAPLQTPNAFGPELVTAVSAYHFCRVEIDGELLTLTAVTPAGEILDTFTRTVTTGVAPHGEQTPPTAVVLRPAYPNPFNAATTFDFSLTAPGPVTLQVYDLTGKAVRTLVDRTLDAGTHRRRWDGRDDAGRELGSGVYLVRLVADAAVRDDRVVLVK